MQTVNIKKKSDLENVLGVTLTKTVLGMRRQGQRVKPSTITLTDTKPPFYLNDGNTLKFYAIDLGTNTILGERYCGSADSAISHGEQFNDTAKAPDNHAMLFVESDGYGYWYLTVVSSNLVKQIN